MHQACPTWEGNVTTLVLSDIIDGNDVHLVLLAAGAPPCPRIGRRHGEGMGTILMRLVRM